MFSPLEIEILRTKSYRCWSRCCGETTPRPKPNQKLAKTATYWARVETTPCRVLSEVHFNIHSFFSTLITKVNFPYKVYKSRTLSHNMRRLIAKVIMLRNSIVFSNTAPSTEEQAVPLVLTYHPRNTQVREIITRNFALLKSDPDTKDIFRPVRILCAYRRDNNLRDILVKRSLQTTGPTDGESGTFPCGRPRCVTCAHTNPSQTLDTPGGQLRFEDKFTCTTSN